LIIIPGGAGFENPYFVKDFLMIIVTIKMVVPPEKQQELLQAFHVVLNKVRKDKGCKSSLLFRDTENEELFLLLEEWETQGDVDRHFRSDNFGILLGAARLLGGKMEMNLHSLSHTSGEAAIKKARPKRTMITAG
jgi:quinol monooxygenase YgiN